VWKNISLMNGTRQSKSKRRTLSQSKTRAFFIFTLLFPLLILFLSEVTLRLVDYGTDLSLFRITEIGGSPYYNMNPAVKARYFSRVRFNPMTSLDHFPITKEPGTFRIFCLGASTTAGYPYGYIGSFSTFLMGRLSLLFPEKQIEVINLGLTATNSFTTLDFAGELIDYAPDLLIVYDGHNEFYGALGAASNESVAQSRWITRLYLRLIHFKVFLLARELYTSLLGSLDSSAEVSQSGTMMERLARGQVVEYDGELYKQTLQTFHDNIVDLIDLCKSQSIPLLLSSQVSNLKDLPPFISRSAEGISDQEREHSDSLMGRAARFMDTADFPAARSLIEQAIEQDPERADFRFRLGQCLSSVKLYREAEDAYRKARDLDALRFRTSSDFNRTVRELCFERGASFVDIENLFRAESPDSIIGRELILEHLHPNSRGYFLMAREYARKIREIGLIAPEPEWVKADTISETGLWEQRALTELDERAAMRRTEILTAGWPFREKNQPPQPPDSTDRIGLIIEQMLDGELAWEQAHVAAAEYYEGKGDPAKAEKEYEALIKAIPFNVSPYLRLSRLLLKQLKYEQALSVLTRSLRVEPTLFAYRALGAIAMDTGKPREAVGFLERAVELSGSKSERVECTYMLALALGRAGLTDRSAQQLHQVLTLDPSHQPAAALLKRIQSATVQPQ